MYFHLVTVVLNTGLDVILDVFDYVLVVLNKDMIFL